MTTSTLPAPAVLQQPPAGGRARATVGKALWVTLMVVVAGGCGWLLYSDLDAAIGDRAISYGALFAFAPVVPLVAVFWWLGLVRPEPLHLLVIALVWGALVATYASLQLNSWLAVALGGGQGAGPRTAVFVAPWVEECLKATVIFAIAWWRRHDFNGLIGGAVYAGLAGIGFAFTENVVYYGQIFQHSLELGRGDGAALDAVQGLFIWRGVAAPFVHPMFTMMTGIGIGIAIRHRHLGVRIVAPVVGYCTAVLLHMSYNTAASFAGSRALVAVYLGVLVPLLLIFGLVVALIRRYERRVIEARLQDYTVYGWLKATQVPFLVSNPGRRDLRRHARAIGRPERRRVRELQRAGVDLGLLRDRLVRGVAGERERTREAQLIAAVRHLLARVSFPDGHGSAPELPPLGSSW